MTQRGKRLADIEVDRILDVVFDPPDLHFMLAADGRLEASSTDVGTFDWLVQPDYVPGSASAIALSGGVIAWERPSDWLEYDIDLRRLSHSTFVVEVSVGVACWCATDHDQHNVHQVSWTVQSPHALAIAFEEAADTVVAWCQTPTDARMWRVKAGLPDSPAPTS